MAAGEDGQRACRDPEAKRDGVEPFGTGEDQILLIAALQDDIRVGQRGQDLRRPSQKRAVRKGLNGHVASISEVVQI